MHTSGIAYANLHDLARPDPLVVLVGREEQKKLFRGEERHVGVLMRCNLCKTLGIEHMNFGDPALRFHVKHVCVKSFLVASPYTFSLLLHLGSHCRHKIKEPKKGEHYNWSSWT